MITVIILLSLLLSYPTPSILPYPIHYSVHTYIYTYPSSSSAEQHQPTHAHPIISPTYFPPSTNYSTDPAHGPSAAPLQPQTQLGVNFQYVPTYLTYLPNYTQPRLPPITLRSPIPVRTSKHLGTGIRHQKSLPSTPRRSPTPCWGPGLLVPTSVGRLGR